MSTCDLQTVEQAPSFKSRVDKVEGRLMDIVVILQGGGVCSIVLDMFDRFFNLAGPFGLSTIMNGHGDGTHD